jgi:hypothetical protein
MVMAMSLALQAAGRNVAATGFFQASWVQFSPSLFYGD